MRRFYQSARQRQSEVFAVFHPTCLREEVLCGCCHAVTRQQTYDHFKALFSLSVSDLMLLLTRGSCIRNYQVLCLASPMCAVLSLIQQLELMNLSRLIKLLSLSPAGCQCLPMGLLLYKRRQRMTVLSTSVLQVMRPEKHTPLSDWAYSVCFSHYSNL